MIQYFPIVTGSLTVLGNINVSGSITTSGSITISGSITSASFATSASNATNAISASYANNLTVAGTLTAQTLVVQTITSSVSTITGSTNFGSLSSNTHTFTGSLLLSGSSTTIGTTNIGNDASNSSLVFKTGGSTSYSGNILTNSNADFLGINGGAGANYNSGSGISLVGNDRYGSKTAGWLTLYAGNAVNNTSYGYISMETSGSERIRITYAGNVGIGTTSPRGKLDVAGSLLMSAGSQIQITGNSGVTGLQIIGQDADISLIGTMGTYDFVTRTNSIERMRVTSTGNVGIGTSSPQLNLHILTSGSAFSSTTTYSSSTSRGILLDQQNGTSNNGNAIWFNNSGLYSAIASTRESSGDWGTDIRFYTHPQVTTNQLDVTERMRITSGGSVFINTTTQLPYDSAMLAVKENGGCAATFKGGSGVWTIKVGTVDTSGLRYMIGFCNDSGATIGGITTNGSTTSYNTTSDYRLKEDLKDTKGLEKVLGIKIYDFKYKNTDITMDGVIAHELSEILPYAVSGEKDGKEMQGVDYSKIVPVLTKAIQELNTKFEEYKATHP